MSIEIADLVAILRADSAQFDTAMVKAREEMRGVAGSAHGATGAISSLALGLGALTIGGLALAVHQAIDFQTTLTQVQNNTTMTSGAVDTMRTGLLQLAASSNAPLTQLASGFMHISNYGFSATDALTILKEAMMSATCTGGDTGKVAELLANVLHEFGMSAAQSGQAMDVLHLAAAQGNMTLEQFVSTAGKSLAMAANLHVPLTDVSAAMSALTRHGIPAAEASTLISGALSKILNPAVATEKVLKQVSTATGIDLVGDFTQAGLASKGLAGVLSDLARASQMTSVNIFKLIPATRGGLAAMILTGNGTTDYKSILISLNDAMAGRVHPTLDAYRRLQQTTSYQMGELGNQVQVLGISIGSILLPPLTQLLSAITPIVAAILSWTQQNPALTSMLVKGAALVGAFLLAFGGAAKVIDWLSPILATLSEFAVPLLAIGGAVAALVLLWNKNFLDIRNTLTQTVWPPLLKVLTDMKTTLGSLFQGITTGNWDAFGKSLLQLKTDAGNLAAALGTAITQIGSHLSWQGFQDFGKWIATDFIPALGKGVSDAATFVQQVAGAIAKAFASVDWGKLLGDTRRIAGDIGHALGTAFSDTTGFIGALTTDIARTFARVNWGDLLTKAGNIAGAIGSALGKIFATVGGFTAGLTSGVATALQGIDWGGIFTKAGNIAGAIGTALGKIFATVGGFTGSLTGGIVSSIRAIDWATIFTKAGNIAGIIGTALGKVFAAVGGLTDAITRDVVAAFRAVDWASIAKTAGAVAGGVGTLIGKAIGLIPLGVKLVGNLVGVVTAFIRQYGPGVVQDVEAAVGVGFKIVGDLASTVGSWLAANVPKLGNALKVPLQLTLSTVGSLAANLWQQLTTMGSQLIPTITKWVGENAGKVGAAFDGLTNSAYTWIAQLPVKAIMALSDPKTGIAPAIAQWASDHQKDIEQAFGTLAFAATRWAVEAPIKIATILTDATLGIPARMLVAVAKMVPDLVRQLSDPNGRSSLLYATTSWVGGVSQAISDALAGVGVGAGKGLVVGLKDDFNMIAKELYDWLGIDAPKSPIDSLASWAGQVPADIGDWLTGVKGKGSVKDAVIASFTGASTWLGDVGQQIISGLEAGMSTGMATFSKWWQTAIGFIPGPLRKLLGINSPSTVMMELGGHIASGLALGMQGGMPSVQQAVAAMGKSVSGVSGGSMRGAISAAGAPTPVHNHIYIDGKEIATQIFNQAAKHRRMRPELVS